MQVTHRLYAPVLIDGVLYRVKLTVKDYVLNDGGKRKNLHAIETVEIEKENALLGTLLSNSMNQTAQPTTGRTISIANLMQGAIRQDGSAFVTNDDAAIDSIGEGLAAITDDDIGRDLLGVLVVCLQAIQSRDDQIDEDHPTSSMLNKMKAKLVRQTWPLNALTMTLMRCMLGIIRIYIYIQQRSKTAQTIEKPKGF
jgi:hypothetical protein